MKRVFALFLVVWMGAATAALAQTGPQKYLLRVSKSTYLDKVMSTYGLTMARRIDWISLYVVTGPAGVSPEDLVARVVADRYVTRFEPEHTGQTGETASAHPDLAQTTATLDSALTVDRTLANFYGALAWKGYANQPAFSLINVIQARTAGYNGAGMIVAVIDSGIDPYNPVLKDVLLTGYDFTRNQPGASEWLDLDSTTASVLQAIDCSATTTQSTAAIMDTCSAAVVTQSTAAIMDPFTVGQLTTVPPVPAGFGHGTMVAALIHAVAPAARILPIKAFRADGTGTAADISQAIYWAVSQGAHILNMSFTFDSRSEEVMYATSDAALRGAIPVAAAGNQGQITRRWPAEHKWVVGVGSTSLADYRSSFSNQGYDTFKIGAPGENLITLFPGDHYASVSGTSFSAALVSGTVALMHTVAPKLEWGATRDVVYKGDYALIFDIVPDSSNIYPKRLILPDAVRLAPVYERSSVKQINNIK